MYLQWRATRCVKPVKNTKAIDISLFRVRSVLCIMTHSFMRTFQDNFLHFRIYFHCINVKCLFFQVRALYDFTGEPGTAELSITAGEMLTVMRDNVGDGWCEGFNQSGKSGLFPAAYVQIVDTSASAPSILKLFHYI